MVEVVAARLARDRVGLELPTLREHSDPAIATLVAQTTVGHTADAGSIPPGSGNNRCQLKWSHRPSRTLSSFRCIAYGIEDNTSSAAYTKRTAFELLYKFELAEEVSDLDRRILIRVRAVNRIFADRSPKLFS